MKSFIQNQVVQYYLGLLPGIYPMVRNEVHSYVWSEDTLNIQRQ